MIGEVEKPYLEWDKPEFPNDIKGFRFLADSASKYSETGNFSGRQAIKHHSTVAFLKEVMGVEMFEWAEKISRQST